MSSQPSALSVTFVDESRSSPTLFADSEAGWAQNEGDDCQIEDVEGVPSVHQHHQQEQHDNSHAFWSLAYTDFRVVLTLALLMSLIPLLIYITASRT